MLRLDPRFLGEGLIAGEYIPGRLVIGYENSPTGESAFQKIYSLLGKGIFADVTLGNIKISSIILKDEFDVVEALGLTLMIITGKLDSAGSREPLQGIMFVEPDYALKPRIPSLSRICKEPERT